MQVHKANGYIEIRPYKGGTSIRLHRTLARPAALCGALAVAGHVIDSDNLLLLAKLLAVMVVSPAIFAFSFVGLATYFGHRTSSVDLSFWGWDARGWLAPSPDPYRRVFRGLSLLRFAPLVGGIVVVWPLMISLSGAFLLFLAAVDTMRNWNTYSCDEPSCELATEGADAVRSVFG